MYSFFLKFKPVTIRVELWHVGYFETHIAHIIILYYIIYIFLVVLLEPHIIVCNNTEEEKMPILLDKDLFY